MPSDPRGARALDLLATPIEQYRLAVAMTLEEVRGHLAVGRSDAEARSTDLEAQLGPFAEGRLDTARLAALFGDRDALDVPALQRLQGAAAVLESLFERGCDLFHVIVAPGGDLFSAVSSRLAEIGRAFAASRIASAARSRGASSGLDEDAALAGFPFAQWSAAERKLAPPVVATVSGADLNTGALAPLLDGKQKLLLILDGTCAPAPLVRLITPGVFVIQAHDLDELGVLATWAGTAVGALVPPTSVRFVHDPSAGPEVWRRMSVRSRLDTRLTRVGGVTCSQQAEELRQLDTLAAAPSFSESSVPRPQPPAPGPQGTDVAESEGIDRLAAWLLRQANLPVPTSAGE